MAGSIDHEEMPNPMNALAYCGLYCQACGFKVAYEEQDRNHLRAMPAKYDRYKEDPLEPAMVVETTRIFLARSAIVSKNARCFTVAIARLSLANESLHLPLTAYRIMRKQWPI